MRNRLVYLITHDGITDTISGWAKRTGLKSDCIRGRLAYDWPIEKILFTPPKKKVTEQKNKNMKIYDTKSGWITPL